MPNSCNNQVLDFADSLSHPSEPPDIRNWFSSYVYESPELNTYENCEDCGLRVSDSEEEAVDDGKRGNQEEEKTLEGTTKNKKNLVSDEVDSNRSKKSTNSAQVWDQTKATEVLGSLRDSLTLSPEPPHVGKWFSSYVYESPSLDTGFEFSSPESHCVEFGETTNYAENCCEEKESNLVDPRSDAERKILRTAEKFSPHGLATCGNSVEDTKSQLQCGDKVIKAVPVNIPNLIDLPKEKRREHHISKVKPTEDQKVASTHLQKRDLDGEFFIGREPLHNASSFKNKKSSNKLAQRSGLSQNPPHMDNIVDLSGGNADKENNKNRISENGFVSTRKKINEVKSGASPSERSVKVPLAVNREYVPKRKPFSEKTNFQHSDVLEITGKWKCPRKNNPKLGPPLKQLRLEQWVSRI